MMLAEYLHRQREWSRRTFGAGKRTIGITKHIEKELREIRQDPDDLMEWIDVLILAMDGYWRAGGKPSDLAELLREKQRINFARTWPAPQSKDEATEHVREPA